MSSSTTLMRVGIDLGGTKIEGIALDPAGGVAARLRRPTPEGYARTVSGIAELVEEIGATIAPRGGRVASVGVGIPGAISPATGLVKNANATALIGHPLDRDLTAALGRPVRVANDANCFTVSEAADGAGRGANTVFGVILGTGVGGGVVVAGRVLTGANAIAGEWGHNPLPRPADDERPGPRCYCGRLGCVEAFLSGPGLSRDHRQATGRSETPEAIAAAAEAGDREADASLARYEDRLARALASVINLLDPDVIVLGGGLSKIARLYRAIPLLWVPHVFSDRIDTVLKPPVHGDSSGVRGAAWLWSPEELPA
jgi:fructokinase